MSATTLPRVPNDADLQRVIIMLNQLVEELDWLLNGFIDNKNIKAGSITATEIKASTITADRMNVTELSAIAADLGHITAGLIEAVTIVGSLIKTADTGQRIELSATDNLLKAIDAAGNLLKIYFDASTSTPSLYFEDPSGHAHIFKSSGALNINSDGNTDINITALGNLILGASSAGKFVNLQFWDKVKGTSGNTLQQELDAKASKSAITKTVYVAATSGAAATTPLTITNGVITG